MKLWCAWLPCLHAFTGRSGIDCGRGARLRRLGQGEWEELCTRGRAFGAMGPDPQELLKRAAIYAQNRHAAEMLSAEGVTYDVAGPFADLEPSEFAEKLMTKRCLLARAGKCRRDGFLR